MTVLGLLVAAGAGSRMGKPKALVTDSDGTPWVVVSRRIMIEGGCEPVVTVLGAAADEVKPLITGEWVVAENWSAGMGESLKAGLGFALENHPDADGVLIHLVDLPDVTSAVVRRVIDTAIAQHWMVGSPRTNALVRAVFNGSPGHPVFIGRAHWAGVMAVLSGDSGAKNYLATHGAIEVECADLATGRDVDSIGEEL